MYYLLGKCCFAILIILNFSKIIESEQFENVENSDNNSPAEKKVQLVYGIKKIFTNGSFHYSYLLDNGIYEDFSGEEEIVYGRKVYKFKGIYVLPMPDENKYILEFEADVNDFNATNYYSAKNFSLYNYQNIENTEEAENGRQHVLELFYEEGTIHEDRLFAYTYFLDEDVTADIEGCLDTMSENNMYTVKGDHGFTMPNMDYYAVEFKANKTNFDVINYITPKLPDLKHFQPKIEGVKIKTRNQVHPNGDYEYGFNIQNQMTQRVKGSLKTVNGKEIYEVTGRNVFIAPNDFVYIVSYVVNENGYSVTDVTSFSLKNSTISLDSLLDLEPVEIVTTGLSLKGQNILLG